MFGVVKNSGDIRGKCYGISRFIILFWHFEKGSLWPNWWNGHNGSGLRFGPVTTVPALGSQNICYASKSLFAIKKKLLKFLFTFTKRNAKCRCSVYCCCCKAFMKLNGAIRKIFLSLCIKYPSFSKGWQFLLIVPRHSFATSYNILYDQRDELWSKFDRVRF